MAKFVDNDGLLYFWQKIKALFAGKVDKADGMGLSANNYTAAEKTKLAGIATGANNYTHPTTAGNKHIPAGGASGKLLGWASDGNAAWVDDKDTTYTDMVGATTTTDGQHGLVPAPIKGAATQYLRNDGSWATPPNTTYSPATQSAPGLMAATDKAKLDGVEAGANKYIHPAYPAKVVGLYKTTVDATGHTSTAAAVTKDDITALGIPVQDTTYNPATASVDGLMTKADKVKMDAIPIPSTIATQIYVSQQVAAAGHIKKSIVASLPAVGSADANTIYMIAKVSGD